ncbi:MAG TPA: FtsQ-type POTRA domain-containing protein [Vicinamibacterales bacterium]|nr:FtsQ-type POTRA domain-containing protein [Vicinamibacterales bacterium]
MSPVAAVAADKRFRRAHLKPSRRRAGWRAFVRPIVKGLLLALVTAYALYRGAALAAHAHALTVDRIVVTGNERLSKGEVIAVLSGLRGESLLFTDLGVWQKRLLASPWVKDAALRRSLPSTIEVALLERSPVGVARMNGDLYLVDERGVIIDQFGPQYADLDLPIIDGLNAGGETLVDESRADLAARVITALRSKPALAKRLSQVDVSDGHNATVILTGDPAVLELGDDQFVPRLESYLSLAPTLRERVADIDYVDLRFDDRIYVRPTHVEKKKKK